VHINIGHSIVNQQIFEAYVGAVEVSNQRAANFVERAHIAAQLSQATMPADIIGRMTVYELAALSPALAERAMRVIAQRLVQITRSTSAIL
jgi:GGDEF domain-containing protein